MNSVTRVPEELSLISKQLSILQEYMTLKFGTEFEEFYKARSAQNIPILHQGHFLYENVQIKTEPSTYNQQSNQNQNQRASTNLGQPNFYYSFQTGGEDGTPGFSFTNQSTLAARSNESPATKVNNQTGTSNKANRNTNTNVNRAASPVKSTDTGKFDCPRIGCKKSFRRMKLLTNHERMDHRSDLVCETAGCKLSFLEKSQLQAHEQRCPLKPHKCSWEGCDKTFRTSKLLHGHISAVHRRVNRESYKCTVPGCTKGYPTPSALQLHENRCRFKHDYDANPDIIINTSVGGGGIDITASALALAQATSNATNPSTSSVYSGGGTYDGRMSHMGMNNIEPITVDMGTFFVKSEMDGTEEQSVTMHNN